jgi:recombination protein RecT
VPYGQECQLIVGYKGYLHLMFRSGGLRDASAQMVYENDKFVGQLGTEPKIEHTINFGKKGKPIGAYVVLRYVNGGTHIETMNMDELQKVQSVSKAKSGPWVDWFEEMCKKTVLKRGAKWGPTGDGLELMARAHEYDDDVIDSTATEKPSQPAPALASENAAQALDNTDKVKASVPAEN